MKIPYTPTTAHLMRQPMADQVHPDFRLDEFWVDCDCLDRPPYCAAGSTRRSDTFREFQTTWSFNP
jgi:hypothetical protein